MNDWSSLMSSQDVSELVSLESSLRDRAMSRSELKLILESFWLLGEAPIRRLLLVEGRDPRDNRFAFR